MKRLSSCLLGLMSFWTLGLCVASLGADPNYQPKIAPASAEGELAIQQFVKPDGFEVKLFAAEPMLANPVVFCLDEQGRVYVCETFRQQQGVEDNRSHMKWLLDDLAAQSVSDRIDFFRKHLGDSVNNYTKEDDRIRLIEDTDGDGKADKATVYADGFRNIEDGTAAGILARGGKVYLTDIPKLYQLQDTNLDGESDQRQVLADGFGVRVAFRGHDMHGLVLGPDGRLYFSIGDRGYHVTSDTGEKLHRPDTGAVFRCEQDGSKLEVFAYGLRNPQELAFDDFGNLFTGDNNSDSGDQARWVYVTQGSDQGWRMYFQYLPDRGPWNRERMWYPYKADDETTRVQPAFIVPPILNLADGPSGLVYYPGVGLPERYDGHFFLCDFRGGAGNSGVRSFGIEPDGATFKVTDSHWFLKSILATDVDFGHDGKVYVSDWVDGWNGPGKGRIYTFEHPESRKNTAVTSAKAIMADGFDQRTPEELIELLSHADRRVRLESQLALASRGARLFQESQSATVGNLLWQRAIAAGPASSDLPTDVNSRLQRLGRLHAIWGLGHLMRLTGQSIGSLDELLKSDDVEVRSQALRVVADLKQPTSGWGRESIASWLKDPSPRVRYFAAIALSKMGNESDLPALLQLLADNHDADPVVRHAAVMGLTSVDADALLKHANNTDRSVRLGLVVALRRKLDPRIAQFLKDGDPQIIEEAARAIHDESIVDALPALARLADSPSEKSDALLRRVLSANFRLGGVEEAKRVARVAAAASTPEPLRLEAVAELLQWEEPSVLDRVNNQFRPIGDNPRPLNEKGFIAATTVRPVDGIADAVRTSLGGILAGPDKVRGEGVKLAAKYGIKEVGPALFTILSDVTQPAQVRAEALTALDAVDDPKLADAMALGLKGDADILRIAARSALTRRQPELALPQLKEVVIAKGSTVAERQAAIIGLASMKSETADAALLEWLRQLAGKPADIPAAVHLDLIDAARSRNSEPFQKVIAAIDSSRNAEDPLSA
ncbi:MAG: HEAT repeat domain-containing protein, partial [Planctomycetaceae bacterium]